MSQTYDRVITRLNNLKAIEPLLGALRTISMGTWQMAQNNLNRLGQFEGQFTQLLFEVIPAIDSKIIKQRPSPPEGLEPIDAFVIVIGSERGLCGKFNESLAENALSWISEQAYQSYQFGAMGSRMIQTLQKMDIQLDWQKSFPTGDLASYSKSFFLTKEWIDQFEMFRFNNLIVLSNSLTHEGQYAFSDLKLLPYDPNSSETLNLKGTTNWPPPIIETDPKGIYQQIIRSYIASTFYKVLLRSAIAENSSRYLLMEEAKQNAQEIIEELNREVNNERKRQITQEMQELAVGAGLIDNK